MSTLTQAATDTVTITRRNLTKLARIPDSIFFGIIQSVMFTLLFAYVFGGAITVPGGSYREFLIGGILVQTVAFACATTAVSMADDLSKGIFDRFRSLPMSRAAVLGGRTTSDLLLSAVYVVTMAITGLLIGWRTHTSFWSVLAGVALLMLFAYSFLWIGAVIGLSVRSPEVAQTAGLLWLFPVIFVSNIFVPLETMPTWLQPLAEWNPLSAVTLAVRELFGNVPAGYSAGDSFPMQYPVIASLLWCVLLLAIFVPMGIARYRHATSR